MSSMLRKIEKKKLEKEKYSFISVDDLEKLKSRAIALSLEMQSLDIKTQSELYKEKLEEYVGIVSDLRKYKKYAKS